MSIYHIRRVPLVVIEQIRAETPDAEDYARAAAYAGVHVGTDRSEGEGWAYFDVVGEDREGLPGEYVCASYDELVAARAQP